MVYPIGIIEISTARKWGFWLYFSSLHNYWPPTTWNTLVHTSWAERENCEKQSYQLLIMRKKNQPKHKNQVRNGHFIDSYVSSMNDYTCHYEVRTLKTNVYINFNKNNENLKIFCLHVTVYLNTKKSFPICMFLVMASGKYRFHIYFTFLQVL